jgi:flagellar assembly protein FliH
MPKIIHGQDVDKVQSWELPSVGARAGGDTVVKNSSVLTASELENIQKQAYEEAYAAGLQEALQAAQGEIRQQLALFEKLLQGLAVPFAELDDTVEEELVTLVIALVKQLVRRELRSDPGQIIAVVREAVEALPVSTRRIQLRLHPEDATLVQELYKMSSEEQTWEIMQDPTISRGGCKVMTSTSLVDASLETRLSQLFAQVFGERQADAEEER